MDGSFGGTKKTVAIALATATLIAGACGGGGGGGGGDQTIAPPPTPPTQSQVKITSANAPDVAGAAVNATTGMQDMSDFVGSGTITANVGQERGIAAARAKTQIALDATGGAFKVPFDETVPCGSGGTLRISGDLQSPDTISVGDIFNSDFSNCIEFGLTLNGSFDFVVTAITGTPQDILSGRFALGASVTVDDFAISQSGETTTGNGDFAFAIDSSVPPVSTLDLSGNMFSQADSQDTLTMSDFVIAVTETDGVPFAYTLSSDGTLDSSELQGSITYVTVVLFEGFGDDFPYTGEMLATGADGSSVRLIALDSVNVRLEVDEDGDGALDQTIDTTWDAISD